MRKYVLTSGIFLMMLFVVCLFAQDYAGESMAIGVGARPLGMGGTFAAIADDASTSYWNPAGLVNVTGVEVSSVKLTKINDLDTKYTYVNLVYNVSNDIGAFGVGWLRQAIGGIPLTVEKNGECIIIKESTENADNTIYVAYGRYIVKGLAIGTSLKILLGNYPALVDSSTSSEVTSTTINYSGFGCDIGLFTNVGDVIGVKELKGLSLGVNVQDVYTTISWDTIQGVSEGSTEQVALNAKPGIAYRLPISQFEIIAGCDVDTKYQLIIHAGGEIWWNKMVGIRGGIKNWGGIESAGASLQQESDWSIGASLRWYFIGVDYAYVYNELTPVQYLSVIGKF